MESRFGRDHAKSGRSGARDLKPGPHGPEIWAVSSAEIDFEGFEFNWKPQQAIRGRVRPLGVARITASTTTWNHRTDGLSRRAHLLAWEL